MDRLAWSINETPQPFAEPFPCSGVCAGRVGKERNRGCIPDRDAQSGAPGRAEFTTGKGSMEGFRDFIDNPGYAITSRESVFDG